VSVLHVLDLVGVFVFAISGALVAVERELDWFGMVVLGLAAGLGGGAARDVLLDIHPPAALHDGGYLWSAVAAAVLVGVAAPQIVRLTTAVRLFDAAGLGLFVAAGTTTAIRAGVTGGGAVVVGCVTGIGGGVLRDVLAGVVPVVLRRELYAVPAVLGASLVVVADKLDLHGGGVELSSAALVIVVRMLAVWRNWHAPAAGSSWLHRRRARRGEV
jgi:uncharacterized membrane protein YeiH